MQPKRLIIHNAYMTDRNSTSVVNSRTQVANAPSRLEETPTASPRRPGQKEVADVQIKPGLMRQIGDAMEPSDGSVGVFGNMYKNGLRNNDSWRSVCGNKAGEVEEKLKELSQKIGVDLLDSKKRNELIDKVYLPWSTGKLGDLSSEELQHIKEIALALKELAKFVRERRVRPMELGDYDRQQYLDLYNTHSVIKGPSYVSPMGQKISNAALNNDFIGARSKHYCLRGVRFTLEAANMANAKAASWAIHSVNYFRENPDFVEVSGYTASQVDELPVGSIVIYNHPSDAHAGREISNATKPGHIQVKVKKPDGSTSWVSDFWQNDGTVYGAMSPHQKVWVFTPKDYVTAGIIQPNATR